jgi:DnaJ-class molecular chaperone
MTADHDQDLYLVFGVDPSASTGQITHAYRALMRRHHPDTRARSRPAVQPNPDPDPDQEHDVALQQIASAYAVLRDPPATGRLRRPPRRTCPARTRPHLV